ncbi:MAG TPA: redoxin domain-containing protein, partial [Chloroflexota bacterium]|nr:redoxin domain-containing protein [Chloroflexota bacterium]
MEPWMMPLWAVAALTLLQGFVLAVILHRLGALYAMLDGALPPSPDATGLPVGAEVPAFAAPDQNGTIRTSDELRGQPYVVAFVHPGCRYCRAVLPLLESASAEHAGRVRFLLATSAE